MPSAPHLPDLPDEPRVFGAAVPGAAVPPINVRWHARLEQTGWGAQITYVCGLYEEQVSSWRPFRRWAERAARRGVRLRNRRGKWSTWTVGERP
jgi:hypothetical protein